MAPGTLIAGKYRVERVLGRGGMGLVVSALHLHLGERVAIKLLLPGSPLTPAARERFLREGRAAARIRSAHVARVLDADVLDSGAPYLVLEHLDGIDLRALVRRSGPLSVDATVRCVLQICAGLADAHALGIVHRDIKPANLFLARERRLGGALATLKIIDFGVSKMEGPAPPGEAAPSLTAYGAAIGTPHYMAPEQMRSARVADARADIWSLGAVIHGLLTGQPPFPGETMIEVYDRILRGAPRLGSARADVPEALEEIVARCLRVDPDERYKDVAEIAAALGDALPPERRTGDLGALLLAEEAESREPRPEDLEPDSAAPEQPSSGTASLDVSAPTEQPTTHGALDPSWADGHDAPTAATPTGELESRSLTETAPATPPPPRASPAPRKTEPESSVEPARKRRLAQPLLTVAGLALAAIVGAALSRRAPGSPPDAGLTGADRQVQIPEGPTSGERLSPSPAPDTPAKGSEVPSTKPHTASASAVLPAGARPVAESAAATATSTPSTPQPRKRSLPGAGTTGGASTEKQGASSPTTPVSAPPTAPALGLSESPD